MDRGGRGDHPQRGEATPTASVSTRLESHAPADAPVDPRLDGFYTLYRREFAFVWATARRYGVPPHAVDDAVQDVFLTAYRRLDQVEFEVSARAWLHGVTRRIAARYRRSAARLARRMAAVAAVPRGPAPAPQERLAVAEELDRLLAGLGRRTRVVFEMTELLGMSGPEVAGELGIPVSTVYSRVRLAREQLVRALGEAPLERALGRARERETPPREAVQRGWALLVPGLVPASAGGGVGLGALASARGVVIAAIAVGGALAWPRLRPADPPAVVADEAGRGGARDSARPERRPVAVDSAPEALEEAAIDAVATAPLDARAAVSPPRLRDADRLAAEVAILDRARASLAGGDLEAARAGLDEHARRFPHGALADLRGATEVELLCRQGAAVEASRRAVALTQSHPRSVVAQRFVGFACE